MRMKAVIALLCLVALATAHRGGPHGRDGPRRMRPTGRPDSMSRQERMEKMKKLHEERKQQWEEKKKQMAANRPTGRPQSWKERVEQFKKAAEERMKQIEEKRKQWEAKRKQMDANRPTGRPQSWRERLEKMKKDHEARKQQWIANRPTGRPTSSRRMTWKQRLEQMKSSWAAKLQKMKAPKDEDETSIFDLLSKWRQQLRQRPTGRPTMLQSWRQKLAERKKQWEAKRKQMLLSRPTGRPQKRPIWWRRMKKDKDADETEILSPFKAHLDTFQSNFESMLSEHQGSFKDLYEKLDQMFKQHHNDLEGVRPTGRPGRDAYEDAHSALHAAHKAAEKKIAEARKQKKIADKQAKLAAVMKSATPFLIHVEGFKKALDSFLEQNPDATEEELWKMLEAAFDKAHKDMDQARPTGRPTKEEKDAHSWAHKNLHKAKDDAEERIEELLQKLKEAQRQKQMTLMKQNAAPFLLHVDGFKQALDSFLEQNPDATEDELWKLLEAAFGKAHQKLDDARPTGRPTKDEHNAHKFAHKALHKAKDTAEERIEALVQKLKEEQKQKNMAAMKMKAGPFLAHVDNFKAAFENLLSQNPTGSRKEVERKLDELFKKFHDQLKVARPTGRPTPEDKEAFEIAHKMLHKHEDESYKKMRAWRKQMEQLTKSD